MEEVKKVIENLVMAINTNCRKENSDIVKKVIDILSQTPYDFSDPDMFNTIVMFNNYLIFEHVVENFHDKVLIQDKHKANFIFLNYSFLARHIEKLIEKKLNTTCCVVDKSRNILKMYLKYSVSGEIEKDCYDELFWLPKFGSNKQWIDFCDGLYDLYYGKNEKYLQAYKILLEEKIRKYHHIKYTLFANMKDGETIIISERYDKEPDNLVAKNGFFQIPKRAFEAARPYKNAKNLGELLNRHYYDVPEDDILKFFIEKTEVEI